MINEENYRDMKVIEHPAFYIGQEDVYMFFKDENDEIFFLKRDKDESEDLFDIGVAIDADEAMPIEADPTAETLALLIETE